MAAAPAAAAAAAPPMPKEIEITPDVVTFFCGNAGKSTYFDIKMANKGAKRAAFKIRCTSANVFRVQPPVGFVPAGGTLIVRLWFQNRRFIESTKHYFAAHIIFNDTAVQPTEVFANKAAKADGVKRLTVVFNKALPPASPAGADEPVAPKSLMAAPSIMPSAMGAPSQAAPPPPAAAPAAAPPPAAAPAK
ncbi:hypothetical protein PRIPAC_89119 [Pristionchus pacificus]|nr:hypothetical protein PRIPAC_89119 [Pristionchus pacificus]